MDMLETLPDRIKIGILVVLTVFPSAAGTGDITGITISPDGWYADIRISGLSTNGAYSMGLGENNSVLGPGANPKLAFRVSSPAFDDQGKAMTFTRTIYGTTPLRRPFPQQETHHETLENRSVTVRVALSDYVYQGDIARADILEGFYTQGGAQNVTASNISVTVSSTAPHQPPIASWSWPEHQRVSGVFSIRAVVFHREAREGRPVRAVEFSVTDGTNTATSLRTTMEIDWEMHDQVPVLEFIGRFDASLFNQGAALTANFTAYPWIGTNVYDTSKSILRPREIYGPISLLCDKDGSYGVTIAKVAPNGIDREGIAYDSRTYNYFEAAPFRTFSGAFNAIRGTNNLLRGRDDIGGGVVEAAAGSYEFLGASNTEGYGSKPKTWATIRAGPDVASGAFVISGASGDGNLSDVVKIEDARITAESPTFRNIEALWLASKHEFDSGAANLIEGSLARGGVWYVSRGTAKRLRQGFQPAYNWQNMPCVLLRGEDLNGFTDQVHTYTALGFQRTNKLSGTTLFRDEIEGQSAPRGTPILAFGKIMGWRTDEVAGQAINFGGHSANTNGFVVAQVIFENTTEGPIGIGEIGSSERSNLNTPIDNGIVHHNVFVGQRMQFAYNSHSPGVIKHRRYWSVKGNYWDVRGVKSDTFWGDGGADGKRVGNWPIMFGVGHSGNINAGIRAIAGPFNTEFAGIHSQERTPLQATPVTYPKFINRKSWDGVQAGDGNGDYRLRSDSPLIGHTLDLVLPYDMDGNRRFAGDDATGAYVYRAQGLEIDTTLLTQRELVIRFASMPGRLYQVEVSTNLKAWSLLREGEATGIKTEVREAVDGEYEFFRINVR